MSEEEQQNQREPERRRSTWDRESEGEREGWRITGPPPLDEPRGWGTPEWERLEERKRNSRQLTLIALMGLGLLVLVAGVLFLPGHAEEEKQEIPFGSGAAEAPRVSEAFQARLLWSTPLAWQEADGTPSPDSASMPSDLAVVDSRVFVLDTNNGRILEVGGNGRAIDIWDETTDERLAIAGAMAMTVHEGKLYVANSSAGNVLVVDLTGHVERVITPEMGEGEKPLRPIGIAVGANGDIFLSDPDNHRVLHLDSDGNLVWSIGSGHRDSGQYGLNSPGSLYLDAQGNLYVVDILNSTVKKYSPTGQFLLSIGQAGDAEGNFSRPKAVAVDGQGNIYVTDSLLTAVEVFSPTGAYYHVQFIYKQDYITSRENFLHYFF